MPRRVRQRKPVYAARLAMSGEAHRVQRAAGKKPTARPQANTPQHYQTAPAPRHAITLMLLRFSADAFARCRFHFSTASAIPLRLHC